MMEASSNYSGIAGAATAFLTYSRKVRSISPSEIIYNPRTRIKTIELYEFGKITLEESGVVGSFHQLSVLAAGCSTSLVLLDGDRTFFQFPVLQTGSFKLECAFFNGLHIYICAANDAPPHLTINWRALKS